MPSSQTIKAQKTPERLKLEALYQNIRDIREGKTTGNPDAIFETLQNEHPKDWLLSVEIAELAHKNNDHALESKVLAHLEQLKTTRPEVAHLISNGLELIFENESVN